MVNPIQGIQTSFEVLIALISSLLSLVILPTKHWGQFYLQSSIDHLPEEWERLDAPNRIRTTAMGTPYWAEGESRGRAWWCVCSQPHIIFEDGRYGFWGFCFLKAPFYVEDCDSEDVVFKVHKKAFTAGILSVIHLLMLMIVYLPVRVLSPDIARSSSSRGRAFSSRCLTSVGAQSSLFLTFGAAFIAACLALAVVVLMSSATDAPSYYKLERDWCYYLQFAVVALDCILVVTAAKKLVDEVDQKDRKEEEHLRRKEVSGPTTITSGPQQDKADDQSMVSVTNIDDFTVYSAPGTMASKDGMYQPLNGHRGQPAQSVVPPMQGSPKATEIVHYVNEGVTVSVDGEPAVSTRSILSEEALTERRLLSNLIEISPSPDAEMDFFNDSLPVNGRGSFMSPGPPSEEGSEHQFMLSPTPTPIDPDTLTRVSPGVPPPPPPPPPSGPVGAQGPAIDKTKAAENQDYQVPSANPHGTVAASDTARAPFGFVLPPLSFKPKNYDVSDETYHVPRGQDNNTFEGDETAGPEASSKQQMAGPTSPPSLAGVSAPPTTGGSPPPPPPPPPPGWQPAR